ncbi:hypothetical protein [Mycobacteroides abscessus]|uniref:hypothetical protein n=1 Tax=Mycobacteroides abscessus TaxID=36809 RepID=UPI0009448F1E|nr:hypothetical protein [Mycobacteroides abscessus]
MVDAIPPVEFEPPYSVDFVAHLHGGCYPDALASDLLAGVRRDHESARLLDALTVTQLELRILGEHFD